MTYYIIGYIIFLIAYGVLSFVILFHLYRYGYKEGASSMMLTLYPIISVVIIVITFVLVSINGF